MKTYIGTKIVQAEPEDKKIGDSGIKYGYKVVYEDGYTSWSPKETFERAYREVTEAEKNLLDPECLRRRDG